MSTIGHNSEDKRLQSFISRVERLNEERKAIGDDIREVMAEAKSAGFDTKIMRKIIAERKMDAAARAEQEALMETYRAALGMISDLPLGEAALKAAQ